jgi:hypothetical protein
LSFLPCLPSPLAFPSLSHRISPIPDYPVTRLPDSDDANALPQA